MDVGLNSWCIVTFEMVSFFGWTTSRDEWFARIPHAPTSHVQINLPGRHQPRPSRALSCMIQFKRTLPPSYPPYDVKDKYPLSPL